MNSSNSSENYRSEYQVAVSSEDNATFEIRLNPTDEHPTLKEIRIGSSYNYHFLPGGDHILDVGKGWGGGRIMILHSPSRNSNTIRTAHQPNRWKLAITTQQMKRSFSNLIM